MESIRCTAGGSVSGLSEFMRVSVCAHTNWQANNVRMVANSLFKGKTDFVEVGSKIALLTAAAKG